MLRAVGDNDLLRVIVQAVILFKTMDDGLLQFGRAAYGRIAGHVLIHCILHGVADGQGRVKIRLAGGKTDDADALCFQGLGLRIHGKGSGRSDPPGFFGNRAGHNGTSLIRLGLNK